MIFSIPFKKMEYIYRLDDFNDSLAFWQNTSNADVVNKSPQKKEKEEEKTNEKKENTVDFWQVSSSENKENDNEQHEVLQPSSKKIKNLFSI